MTRHRPGGEGNVRYTTESCCALTVSFEVACLVALSEANCDTHRQNYGGAEWSCLIVVQSLVESDGCGQKQRAKKKVGLEHVRLKAGVAED